MLFVNHLGCIITLLLACNMGFSWVMEYLHPYSFNLLWEFTRYEDVSISIQEASIYAHL